MQKTLSITALAALAAVGAGAQAQDITAPVISATPIVQQVQVPRTVCASQPMTAQPPASGGGAVIGAIAGGLLGGGIGAGLGQVAATGLGVVAGAAVGDRVERGPGTMQMAQACNTQTFAENRTVGYNVTYEYGGRQYTVQTPNDPGPAIRLQMSPVGASAPSNPYPVAYGEGMSAPAGTMVVPGMVASATTVYPGYATAVYPGYAAPAYPAYYPGYYGGYSPAYYAPIGVSLGFGFSRGWGHRGHGHHRGGYRR